ncbi:glycosyltransferase family 8 protein [Ewingella americana]
MDTDISPKLHIAMGITSNYTMHAYVTLYSLLSNNRNVPVVVYLLSNTVGSHVYENLEKEFNCQVIECHVDNSVFEQIDCGNGHLNQGTLYRLLLDKYIPNNTERVLYLDADIVVNCSIKDILDLKFDEKNLIAAVICNVDKKHLYDIEVKPESYFNAGVILFDFKRCIKDKIFERTRELIKSRKFKYLDQDVLNIALEGRVMLIAPTWNYDYYRVKTDLLNGQKIISKDSRKIFHYTGRYKPWNKLDPNPYGILYKEYYKKAFNKDVILENNHSLYSALFYYCENIIFKIKPLASFYLILRHYRNS